MAGGSLRRVTDRITPLLRDLVGYGAVSAVALGSDYGLLLFLTWRGLHYLAAQALSFCVGMAVAYGLSVRFVFAARRDESQLREAMGFAAIGMAGLVLTQCLLAFFVSGLGVDVALAKLPVACGVFLFNFVARRSLVFGGTRAARP